MRAHVCKVIPLALALLACSNDPAALIPNHDPATQPTIVGIERLGEGPYRAGETEHFRAMVQEDVAEYRWEASGGALEPLGEEVLWTLPEEQSAWLRLSVTLPGGEQRASDFMFLSAAPGDIDPSTDVTGSVCDLVFDRIDKPHLIYRNDTHPSIWYATYVNGAWTAELVDGMGFDTGGQVVGTMSITVDANNRPHLAYLLLIGTTWQVRYAHKSATGWIVERVDTTWPYFSVAPEAESVAIALNSLTGQPTIAYTTSPPSGQETTVIAYRTGVNTWVNETGVGDEHEFAGGLVFDASGIAYFTMRDEPGNQDIWLGTWPPFAESAVDLNAYSPEGARLVLDTQGQPIALYRNGLAHRVAGTWIYSEIESFDIAQFDLAFGGGKPHVAVRHGTHLEMITTDSRGYWQYTDAGTADAAGVAIAIDATGLPHACFKQNNAIAFY